MIVRCKNAEGSEMQRAEASWAELMTEEVNDFEKRGWEIKNACYMLKIDVRERDMVVNEADGKSQVLCEHLRRLVCQREGIILGPDQVDGPTSPPPTSPPTEQSPIVTAVPVTDGEATDGALPRKAWLSAQPPLQRAHVHDLCELCTAGGTHRHAANTSVIIRPWC